MNKLYENVGGTLKAVAKITAVILAVACAAGGLILLGQRIGSIKYVGLAIAVVGPFISWLISLPLYAFGEAVEKLGQIEENTRNGAKKIGAGQNDAKKASYNKTKPKQQGWKKQTERNNNAQNAAGEDSESIRMMWVENGWICPQCGKLVSPGKDSCYGCGHKISESYEMFADFDERISGTCDICDRLSDNVYNVDIKDKDFDVESHICYLCLSKVLKL